ncbi:MAG: sodium:calcium antiporter [Desulfosarcina sp.]|nr:sodium:calcium antiporter [Desulfosarcina sp.]
MIAPYFGGIQEWPIFVLLTAIVLLIMVLGKGADILVEEAIRFAAHWNIPTIVVGATIVSLGTTLPEAAVSVMAAMKGQPDIALGNAVGSVICDTGLILGVATLLSPLPLKRHIVNRQGWLQFAAGCLLIISCIPFLSLQDTFTKGGMLPRFMGVFFLLLLLLYLWFSFRLPPHGSPTGVAAHMPSSGQLSSLSCFLRLMLGIGLVVTASHFLIPIVRVTAIRLNIAQGIVSATLVAFGTSLPELVTAVTAVRKGHGELAVGNVIGADILNVLFVAGASASVSASGLLAPPLFFTVLFPAMFILLVVFRLAVQYSGAQLKRSYGVVLVGTYLVTTYVSYTQLGT